MVSTAPDLPAGFKSTFKDRFVKANGIRQHVVIGGEVPRFSWCTVGPRTGTPGVYVMPELAKHYTVIAVDQRGIGLTEKAKTGTTPRPWQATWPPS